MSSFKKKPTVNPTLHEGLLFLIHEHFKAQTISNIPLQVGDEVNDSSSYSSNSDEIQSISSKGEGITSSRKKISIHDKKLPSPITPSRKSPRGHGQKLSRHEEKDYNKQEDDMESKDKGREKREEKRDD